MFEAFRKEILQYESVGIFSHLRPDGDCIGAQVAMALWLEKNGVRALAFNDHEVPASLTWLADYFPIELPEEELTAQCDAFLVVDGNAPHRFGSFEVHQHQFPRPTFMIDHHPDPVDVFDHAISVDDASSTCELVYKLIAGHDETQLDEQICKALYTGVVTDTGSFQFASVAPETMEVAAGLMRHGGFRPPEVVERVFSNKSLNQLQLLSLALDSLTLYENNQIAIMTVTKGMLDKTRTRSEDCDGLVNFALNVDGVKAAVLLKDIDEQGVKLSLRSRSEVDVNEWARELGGGGHKKAAGALHPGPLDSAIHDIIKIGVKQLKRLEDEKVLP